METLLTVLLAGLFMASAHAQMVDTSGESEKGHLWIAGRVIVAADSEFSESGCVYQVLDDNDEVLAQIDASGNLLLRGLLYASGVPVRDVGNWPFKSGGGLPYE